MSEAEYYILMFRFHFIWPFTHTALIFLHAKFGVFPKLSMQLPTQLHDNGHGEYQYILELDLKFSKRIAHNTI